MQRLITESIYKSQYPVYRKLCRVANESCELITAAGVTNYDRK